jgi:hypothetical protein
MAYLPVCNEVITDKASSEMVMCLTISVEDCVKNDLSMPRQDYVMDTLSKYGTFVDEAAKQRYVAFLGDSRKHLTSRQIWMSDEQRRKQEDSEWNDEDVYLV